MKKGILKIIVLSLIFLSGKVLLAQPYGDYTFYSPKNSAKAYLIDFAGATYHTWTFASNKPTGYSSYLLPGGTVLRTVAKQGTSFQGGGMCGEVMKVDWNNNVVWDYVYSTSTYCSHHDVCAMPNGNILLIAYELKTASEVSQAGCSQSITMWPDKIVEIQPSGTSGGTVVWEWHVWDHLCQNLYPAKDNYVTSVVEHPELLNINYKPQKDWMHVNGVDYNEALDQIVFSSHMMNEIYVIDHSTTTAEAAGHTGGNSGKGGDFLYRWGNPAAYQASGNTNFNVVHDAHWVPADCPKANHLVAFNNKGGTGNKSCIDMVYPPYDGYNYSHTPGSAYAPSTYGWRHTYSGTPSQNEGQSQQLPNGNMLITISMSGYIYEIDSNQNVLWSKSISGSVTNARRYTACYVNGLPATPVISYSVTHDSLVSSAATGNQWFVDGTAIGGSTGQYLVPAGTGSYQVQVTDGNGCKSEMSLPVVITGVGADARMASSTLRLYPNPTPGMIRLGGTFSSGEAFTVRIYNPAGRMVMSGENQATFDLSALPGGIYFLQVRTLQNNVYTRKVILVK